VGFDFGERLYEKPNSFKLWPTEGEFTALVDADLLPYIVGYTTEDEKYAAALYKVRENIVPDVESTPEFMDAADHLDWLVNHWVGMAKADSAILYITDGASNFRIPLAFTWKYKGQRTSDKPAFFYELRNHLVNKHNAIISDGCEADDLIVTEMGERNRDLALQGAEVGSRTHASFSDCIAISRDKDLRICPGWHLDPTTMERVWTDVLGWLDPAYKISEVINYRYVDICKIHGSDSAHCLAESGKELCTPDVYTRGKRKGEVKQKRIKDGVRKSQSISKLKGVGLKFFYSQLLVGDSADNYPGVPGVGLTRAFEVLHKCDTEEGLYNAVLEEYVKKYPEPHVARNYRGGFLSLTSEQRMVEQGRLAWIRQATGEIWREGISLPSGEGGAWKS